jgi:hypothetical protein
MKWFRPAGLVFVPVSVFGWIATFAATAFCAQVFWAIDRHSHSATDTLYGVYPFWGTTFLGLAWLADRTGGRN